MWVDNLIMAENKEESTIAFGHETAIFRHRGYDDLVIQDHKYTEMKELCMIRHCDRHIHPDQRRFKYSECTLHVAVICPRCAKRLVEEHGHKLIPYPSKLEETVGEYHQELAIHFGDKSQRVSGVPLPE